VAVVLRAFLFGFNQNSKAKKKESDYLALNVARHDCLLKIDLSVALRCIWLDHCLREA